MKKILSKIWRTLLWRGLIALAFGIMAFAWPGLTIVTFIYLFAFYAMADGFSTLTAAWQNRKTDTSWGILFFTGLLSLLVGLITLFYPGITALYLLILIGLRAVFDGILTIAAAIRLRKEIHNEGWLALGGMISIVFGIWVIMRPGEGALAFASLIALFAIVIGIVLIVLALKARSWSKGVDRVADNIRSSIYKS